MTRRARASRRGLTLLEVLIAVVVITILVLASAAAFSGSIGGARAARKITSGTLYLETVAENFGAQPASNLLSLDGTTTFDGTNASDSEYRVDVTTFEAAVELVQVELALVEVSTGRAVGALVTQRSLR